MGDIIGAISIIITLENTSATDFNRSFTKEYQHIRHNSCTKRHSTSFVNREIRNKKTQWDIISQPQPFLVVKMKKTDNITLNTGKDVDW